LKLKKLEERRHPDDDHLTDAIDQNIIQSDLRKQDASGRHQIGTLAGFRLEQLAGFRLECMADIVGTRSILNREVISVCSGGRPKSRAVT
jgi:hypothetical protein